MQKVVLTDDLFRIVKLAYVLSIPKLEIYLLFVVPIIYWFAAGLLFVGFISSSTAIASILVFWMIDFYVPLRFFGSFSPVPNLIDRLVIDPQSQYWKQVFKVLGGCSQQDAEVARKVKIYLRAYVLNELKYLPRRVATGGIIVSVMVLIYSFSIH